MWENRGGRKKSIALLLPCRRVNYHELEGWLYSHLAAVEVVVLSAATTRTQTVRKGCKSCNNGDKDDSNAGFRGSSKGGKRAFGVAELATTGVESGVGGGVCAATATTVELCSNKENGFGEEREKEAFAPPFKWHPIPPPPSSPFRNRSSCDALSNSAYDDDDDDASPKKEPTDESAEEKRRRRSCAEACAILERRGGRCHRRRRLHRCRRTLTAVLLTEPAAADDDAAATLGLYHRSGGAAAAAAAVPGL